MSELKQGDIPANGQMLSDDLMAWADRAGKPSLATSCEKPGDAFFASPELRDTYSVPLNDHVCLIDLEAFPEGPVEGLSYGKATPLFAREGNVYQFLLSEDGDKLAIVSAFTLDALKSGALAPEDLGNPTTQAVATGVIVGTAKCAASPTCRAAVVKGAKWVASSIGGGALWEGIKRIF